MGSGRFQGRGIGRVSMLFVIMIILWIIFLLIQRHLILMLLSVDSLWSLYCVFFFEMSICRDESVALKEEHDSKSMEFLKGVEVK